MSVAPDPGSLRPAGSSPITPREWILRHLLGLIAILLGATSFTIAAIRQDHQIGRAHV